MGKIENIQEHLDDRSFEFLKQDVTESETFRGIGENFDCIVHLAAFKIPCYGKAINTLLINSKGTANVLEFASKIGSK